MDKIVLPARAMTEPGIPWVIRGDRALTVSAPFGIMGIVNLTPDSFYDGGRHGGAESCLAHALTLLEDGADVLDLGAESSRPGAEPISPQEELSRLLPTLTALQRKVPDAVISVDTWRADTAATALEAGAAIINDISGCRGDAALPDVLAQYKPGYVLMHGAGFPADREVPSFADICGEVMRFFEQGLARLTAAGLPENRIVLDPGIGFGKRLEHNVRLLARVEDWACFGRPVLLGLSMKSLFGKLLGLPTAERGPATQVASALLWERGVFWHRVHDVRGVRQALALAAAMRRQA